MRTTEVRALLPDAWGFICPVHTPDGSPCGLLNHLAMPVELVTHAQDASKIPQVLVNLGRQYRYNDCTIAIVKGEPGEHGGQSQRLSFVEYI